MAIIKLAHHGNFAKQGTVVALFPPRVYDTTQDSSEEAELPLDICPQQITVRRWETQEVKGRFKETI